MILIKNGKLWTRISIRRALFFSYFAIAFSMLFTMSVLWIYTEIGRSNEANENLLENAKSLQKKELKEKVENLLDLIQIIRNTSIEKTEEEVKSTILNWIESLRFEYGGYYFVNQLDGKALIFDGKRVLEDKNLLDMTDPNGLRIFDREIEAFHNPEGLYMTYLFKKIESDIPEPKISFMKGIPDWNWIVGAGNYLTDVTLEIEQTNLQLKKDLAVKISKILLAFLLFTILLFILSHFFSKFINAQIDKLNHYVQGLITNTSTSEDHLTFKEFEKFANQVTHIISSKSKLEADLSESEQHFKELIENSPNSIVITNVNGTIQFINQETTNLTGYSKEELLGQNPRILKSGKTDPTTYENMWNTILEGKNWKGRFVNKKKNGEEYVVLSNIASLKDKNGQIKQFITIKEDITESIKLQEELKRALQEANEAARLQAAFLNNMSHEIRTPLNVIVGFSNLLAEADTEDSVKAKYVDLINSNSDHLLNLVNEILTVARMESTEKVQLNRSSVNILELGTRVIDSFAPFCQNNDFQLLLVPDPDHPEVQIETDLHKLTQVFNSLISNAIKFTSEGFVRLSYHCKANGVQFRVEDTGIGIEPEEIEKIFDRFYQVNQGPKKKYSGVGLGLNITRKLVHFLGGSISVESIPGKGSCFFFTLPYKITDSDTSIQT